VRFVLLVLLFLLVGITAALATREDTGYVLIAWQAWTAEMTVTTLVGLLAVAVVGSLMAARSVAWLWGLPQRLRAAQRERLEGRARRALLRGLAEMAEGRYGEGERQLVRYAGDSEAPMVHYLLAARAAHRRGASERRDAYLRAAADATPNHALAVLLTQAELQLDAHEVELALATLRRLQELKPGHQYGLRLLARAYEMAGDLPHLESLLPRLRKAPSVTPEELTRVEVLTIEHHIARHERDHNEAGLKGLWRTTPRRLRHDPRLARRYARALIVVGAQAAAEVSIRAALKTVWDEELVLLYGRVKGRNALKQLGHIEGWLAERPSDAALLLSAGRLCIANQLWGKARAYLEASLAIAPRVDALEELGNLHARLGAADEALSCYRDALELSLKGKVRKRKRKPRRSRQAAGDDDADQVVDRSSN
jgi:HemY protein